MSTAGHSRTTEPAGRRRSPRGQGDRLREEVLGAVNRLLERDGGADRLTMRAVAREVGVAPPSLYLHFADKAELVWAALSDKYAQLADRMARADRDAAAATAGDPATRARHRLLAQLNAYLDFAAENPGHYRLMFEVRQPGVDPQRVVAHPSSMVTGSLREAVARCADAGSTVRLPPRQLAHTLWAEMHGLLALNHSLAIEGAEDLVAGCVHDLLDVLVITGPTTEASASGSRVEDGIGRLVDPAPDRR